MDYSTPGLPGEANYWSSLKLMSIKSVMPSNHVILCHPLLLLPSIFPSIRVFSNESALRIKWPKYWSFSYSNAPSSAYSGLISFRINWFFISLQSKGLSQESFPTPQFKSINSSAGNNDSEITKISSQEKSESADWDGKLAKFRWLRNQHEAVYFSYLEKNHFFLKWCSLQKRFSRHQI